MIFTHLSAAAALTLKRQRAAKAAQPSTNQSSRGGLGGNPQALSLPNDLKSLPSSASLPNPAPGWSRLRASLPESFQAKIAAAEQQREKQHQREEYQRQLAELRRSRLPVDTSPEALAALERELAIHQSQFDE